MKKTAAVITVSDKGARGERIDTSGPALRDILTEYGLEVIYTSVIPDEADMIKNELISVIDEKKPRTKDFTLTEQFLDHKRKIINELNKR